MFGGILRNLSHFLDRRLAKEFVTSPSSILKALHAPTEMLPEMGNTMPAFWGTFSTNTAVSNIQVSDILHSVLLKNLSKKNSKMAAETFLCQREYI